MRRRSSLLSPGGPRPAVTGHEPHRAVRLGRRAVRVAVDELTDRVPRNDPVLPRSGGPAGNLRITAWTGLVLLVLLAIEGVTLLDIRGLLGWHIVVGLLLVPPAGVKVASTGWRIVRYYSGHPAYRASGPPQLLMRVLGPLVVLSTVLVLATGVLVALHDPATPYQRLLGSPVTTLLLHKASFVAWLVIMAAHVLGRTVRATRVVAGRLAGRQRVPGVGGRMAVLAGMAAGSVALAARLAGPWLSTWQHSGRH